MKNTLPSPEATVPPFLLEDNGELSLHFNFPTIQSRMLTSDPKRLILDYTRTMMGFLLFLPEPKRVAMIGLGGGSLAKYCHCRLPTTDFTAIELSPDVIALRDRFDIPPDDARFRVLCADGAEFVRHETKSFDALLVDGFDSEGQPETLSSASFYDNCHAAIKDDGILVVNLCRDDPKLNIYLDRLNHSFSGKVVAVEADEGENCIVFATKGLSCPPKLSEITDRLRKLEQHHPVDLDKTAQKILGSSNKRSRAQRKRR